MPLVYPGPCKLCGTRDTLVSMVSMAAHGSTHNMLENILTLTACKAELQPQTSTMNVEKSVEHHLMNMHWKRVALRTDLVQYDLDR